MQYCREHRLCWEADGTDGREWRRELICPFAPFACCVASLPVCSNCKLRHCVFLSSVCFSPVCVSLQCVCHQLHILLCLCCPVSALAHSCTLVPTHPDVVLLCLIALSNAHLPIPSHPLTSVLSLNLNAGFKIYFGAHTSQHIVVSLLWKQNWTSNQPQ